MFKLQALTENTHPIFTQRGFVIHTRQLAELHGKVREAVSTGTNTLAVYGAPGSGKTTACLELVGAISDSVPTFSAHVLCRQYQNPQRVNLNSFWNDVLTATGRTDLGTRKSDAEQAVYRYILARCETLKNRRLFLIFDEAQNLPPILLSELKNFHDKLLENKHYPFFLFVGQKELIGAHEKLVAKTSFDLVRRFFLRWHEFKSPPLTDLGNILKSYDDVFRFPAGGPTFTEYFAPKSYETGWRLHHEAEALIKEFQTLAKRFEQKMLVTLEMNFVTSVARNFLVRLHKEEKSKAKIDFDVIREAAVENCGLVEQWASFEQQ